MIKIFKVSFRSFLSLLMALSFLSSIPIAYADDSLLIEAKKIVQLEINHRLFILNGKDHFGMVRYGKPGGYGSSKYLHQTRGLKIDVEEEPLTISDKLNGIVWLGKTTLSYQATRTHYYSDDKWGEWGYQRHEKKSILIRKKNGRWESYSNILKRLHDDLIRPTLEDVELALKQTMKDRKWTLLGQTGH